jgi:peptidoglycan/xylan/chitin deacetylase (PgdA/CDA1 family)
MTALTIITYHYVRPTWKTRFPGLKSLDLGAFEQQLKFLCRTHQFIPVETLIFFYKGEAVDLPKNPALLTFDDGFSDHFRYVFPRLFDLGIPGAFFPVATAALDRQILDAHRVHFVLASLSNPDLLIEMIEDRIEAERRVYQVLPVAKYRAEYMTRSRFDEPGVAYAKRMLQFVLPERLRSRIADEAFRRFVTVDAAAFAEELYMGTAELRTMRASGMHIGLHGDHHVWLGKMPRDAQEIEIKGAFRLLDALGLPRRGFSFCFPFGSYNNDTLSLLKDLGCAIGLTTRSALARLADSPLELPRIDTTHLLHRDGYQDIARTAGNSTDWLRPQDSF